MKKTVIVLLALASLTWVAGHRIEACEGELEWESLPLLGSIDVKYDECQETQIGFPQPLVRQTLRLSVSDGLPHETYHFIIKGRLIATIETDDTGEGEFRMRRHGLRPDAEGRPPRRTRIDAGDLCEVFVESDVHRDVFTRI